MEDFLAFDKATGGSRPRPLIARFKLSLNAAALAGPSSGARASALEKKLKFQKRLLAVLGIGFVTMVGCVVYLMLR